MEMHVRLGATKDGIIKGIDLHTLSNTGAYGEHGPTTVGLSGHKSIPLYGKAEAFRFVSDVVYTNHMSSGAYRGYGATQGLFAVESAVNELADKLGWTRSSSGSATLSMRAMLCPPTMARSTPAVRWTAA